MSGGRKLVLLLVMAFLIVINIIVWKEVYSTDKALLQVHFLDVGQGDAIFIETPTNRQILIDAGRDKSVLRGLGKKMPFYDRSIDVVIPTHPDYDHIGGLPEVYKRFKVDVSAVTEVSSQSAVYDAYQGLVEKEGSGKIVLRSGSFIDLGDGVVLQILFPDRDIETGDSNSTSLVAKLIYGETSFLLTGDAPAEVENYVAYLYGADMKTDVLKVSHHGSKSSSAPAFLSATSPSYAVISAGCDNRYGHPHREVVDRIEKTGAQILETCNEKTITFESDGKNVLLR